MTLKDEKARKKIREDFKRGFLVEASAGTGKTTSLVNRITNALLKGVAKPREIAAVTFTKKAADELRSKIICRLFEEQASDKNSAGKKEKIGEIIKNIGNCEIATIHSFYQRMLSERPLEGGLDAQVKVMEESDTVPDNIWSEYIEKHLEGFERYDDLIAVMEVISISPAIFKSYCFDRAAYPDLKLAGIPDTRSRWDDFIKDPIAMFKKFVEWIPESIEKCENPREDSYCRDLEKIKTTWENLEGGSDEDKIAFISQIKKVTEVKGDEMKNNWGKDGHKSIGKREWENAKSKLGKIRTLIADYLYSLAEDLNGHFSDFFNKYKKEHSMITFVDALVKTRDMLKKNSQVREYFRNKYKMVLVDEFQDTDPVQAEVMAILCSEDEKIEDWRELKLVPGKFFAVGDPKQSIFRFRRADIAIYEEFKKLFDGKKNEILKLQENFRSLEGITTPVNKHFKEVIEEKEDCSSPKYEPINSHKGEGGGVTVLNLKLEKDDDSEEYFKNRKRKNGLKVDYLRSREQKTFAGWLKKSLDEGYFGDAGPGDVLILFRRAKYIEDWAKALEEKDIPVENISGKDFFSRDEIKDALSVFTAVALPNDTASVYGALKSPVLGLTDTEIFGIIKENNTLNYNRIKAPKLPDKTKMAVELLKELRDNSFEIPESMLARHIIERTGMLHLYSEVLNKPARASALVKLTTIMEDMVEKEGLDFYGALQKLSDLRENEERNLYLENETPSGVRLMTIHQAKGMESNIVVLGDMSAGKTTRGRISNYINRSDNKYYRTFVANRIESYEKSKDFESIPADWKEKKEDEFNFVKEEENRLRYVACTRAAWWLVIPSNKALTGRVFFKKLLDFLINDYDKTKSVELKYTDYLTDKMEDPVEITPDDSGFEDYKNKVEEMAGEFNRGIYRKTNPSVLDEKIYSSKGGYGKDHGSQVHRILSLLMEGQLNEGEINYDDFTRPDITKEQIKKAQKESIWQRALNSGERYTEFPVTFYDKQAGEMLTGSIDLVFREGDGWVIADYKTNRIENEKRLQKLKSHYEPQMEAYKDAFEKITGKTVKQTQLLFLDQ